MPEPETSPTCPCRLMPEPEAFPACACRHVQEPQRALASALTLMPEPETFPACACRHMQEPQRALASALRLMPEPEAVLKPIDEVLLGEGERERGRRGRGGGGGAGRRRGRGGEGGRGRGEGGKSRPRAECSTWHCVRPARPRSEGERREGSTTSGVHLRAKASIGHERRVCIFAQTVHHDPRRAFLSQCSEINIQPLPP